MSRIDGYTKKHIGREAYEPQEEAQDRKYNAPTQAILEASEKHRKISDEDYIAVVEKYRERRAKILKRLGFTRKNLKRAAVLGAIAGGALLGTTFYAGAVVAPGASAILKAKGGMDFFLGITKNIGQFIYDKALAPAGDFIQPAVAEAYHQGESVVGKAEDQLESLKKQLGAKGGENKLFSTGAITEKPDPTVLDKIQRTHNLPDGAGLNEAAAMSRAFNIKDGYETYSKFAADNVDFINNLKVLGINPTEPGFSALEMPSTELLQETFGKVPNDFYTKLHTLQYATPERGPLAEQLASFLDKTNLAGNPDVTAGKIVKGAGDIVTTLYGGEGTLFPEGQYPNAGKYTKYAVPATAGLAGIAAMRTLQPIKTLVPATATEPLYMKERWNLGREQRQAESPAERTEISTARQNLDKRRNWLVNQAAAFT